MKENPQIERILDSIKKSYGTSHNQQIINSLIKIPRDDIQFVSKRIVQFLFYHNFVILNAQSTNSLRHYFPKDLNNKLDFFTNLRDILKLLNIDIKTIELSRKKAPTYFYFENYKSFFKLLLLWDKSWAGFPKKYLKPIKEFINGFDIYLNLSTEFINEIFGDKGLIKSNKITITKFFKNILLDESQGDKEEYQRHAFYKWRDEKYFPISVFYKLIVSKYGGRFRNNLFKSITSIKIGRTSEENILDKNLLFQIKNSESDIFEEVIPFSSSMLGWLFKFQPKSTMNTFDYLGALDQFLKTKKPKDLPSEDIIEDIIRNLKMEKLSIKIVKLTIKNFKSLEKFEIFFQDSINIIYGLNGSGKTSVLQSILFVLFISKEFKSDIFDTSVITSGRNYTAVKIEIKKGNEQISIERKLTLEKTQEIILEKGDEKFEIIFDESNLSINGEVKLSSKKIKQTVYEQYKDERSRHIYFPYKYYREIIKIIDESIYDFGISINYSEVFLAYILEYTNFEYYLKEDYDKKWDDIRHKEFLTSSDLDSEVYQGKFMLNFTAQAIKDYYEKEQNVDSQITTKLVNDFSPQELLNNINENFYYSINLDKDICILHGGVIVKPGAICQKCQSKYCEECAMSMNECVKCGEPLLPSLVDYNRRTFKIEEIMELFEEFNVAFKPAKSVFDDTPIAEYNLKLKSRLMERLYLSIKNPFFDYFISFLNYYFLNSKRDDSYRKVRLRRLKLFIKKSEKFDPYNLINYFSQLIFIKMLNYDDRISKETKDIIYKEFREAISAKYNKINTIVSNLKASILTAYPFERKIIIFLSMYLILLRSKMFDEGKNDYSIQKEDKMLISDFINKNQALIEDKDHYFNLYVYNHNLKMSYGMDYDAYSIIRPYEIDFIIYKHQLKNILNFIKKCISIKNLEKEKEFFKDERSFLDELYYFLYKKCLEHLRKRFEVEFKNHFKDESFVGFLDKRGIPYIRFKGASESLPITILSGAEKNKILILMFTLLNDFSELKTFFLIDEPNELLDPDNIDLVKKFFLNFFNERQLIICTYIDKYKEFQPALVYNVWKDRHNISHAFRYDGEMEMLELYKKRDLVEKKIEENPKDYHYKREKLVLLIDLNIYKDALKYFQSLKDLDLDIFDIERLESSLENIVELEKVRNESNEKESKFYRARALIYYDLKELHKAIKDIDEALKIGPKMPEMYNFKAENLRYTKKPKKALETIEEGIKLFPKHNGFYRTRSEILEALGRNEEALQDINKAIEIDNDGYWVFYKKAYILNKLERYEDALTSINDAIEFEPHDFVLIQDKISILQNLKRIDEAIKLFNQENEHNVFSPDTYKQFKAQLLRDKAYNLMESGEKDESINTIKEAIELQPDWPEYIQPYGEILMHFGEYKAALEQLEKANSLPLSPLDTPIHIGICLYELGRYEEALENLNQGKTFAKYSVKSTITTDDGKKVTVDAPQTELIKKAENYISKVEKKLKEIEKT